MDQPQELERFQVGFRCFGGDPGKSFRDSIVSRFLSRFPIASGKSLDQVEDIQERFNKFTQAGFICFRALSPAMSSAKS